MQRLHEDTDEDNLLRRWPTVAGYIYKADGSPITETATTSAYDIFNGIVEEADGYHTKNYLHFKGSQRLRGQQNSTRLSTFYNGRKHKALESIRKSESNSSCTLVDVDMALAGLQRVLAVEAGDDLSRVRLEMFGSRVQLPGGHVTFSQGAGSLIEAMKRCLPSDCARLSHEVTHIDWSLLSRDPRVPDKVAIECVVASSKSRRDFRTYYADYVICTLPLGVLKHNYDQLFHPSLDEQKVIDDICFNLLCFVWFEFSKCVSWNKSILRLPLSRLHCAIFLTCNTNLLLLSLHLFLIFFTVC